MKSSQTRFPLRIYGRLQVRQIRPSRTCITFHPRPITMPGLCQFPSPLPDWSFQTQTSGKGLKTLNEGKECVHKWNVSNCLQRKYFLQFDKNIPIPNKIPNTPNVDTTPPEQWIFRDPIPIIRGPVQHGMVIHCVLHPGYSTNSPGISIVIRISVLHREHTWCERQRTYVYELDRDVSDL